MSENQIVLQDDLDDEQLTDVTTDEETPNADAVEKEIVRGEELSLEDLVGDVVSALDTAKYNGKVSPYQIHSVINTVLEALGAHEDKFVRPQMMYNYDRNGLIVKGKSNVKRYDPDEVTAYVIKLVTKRMSK